MKLKIYTGLTPAFCLLLALFCSGCGPASPAASEPEAAPVAETSETPSTAPSSETPAAGDKTSSVPVKLEVVTWEQAQQLIAEQQGKIVVIDFWSTYCPPCIKELPGLVSLQKELGSDVVCLTLNCNFNGLGTPDEERESIEKVLREVGAADVGRHLVSGDPDEQLYKKLDVAGVPVVQVYDRTGKLAKQFDNDRDEYGRNGFNYEQHVTPFVKGLVAAP